MKELFSRKMLPIWAVLLVVCIGIGVGGFFLIDKVFVSDDAQPADLPVTQPTLPVETTAAQPQVFTASLVNCGDLMCEYPLSNACYDYESGTFDFNPCFTYVKSILESGDIAAANLECVLDGSEYPMDEYNEIGYVRLLAPDALLDAAANAGFDLLTTANNHANDAGLDGMLRTLEMLDSKGISHTGTRSSEDEKPYVIKEANGIRFGFIAYTYEGETEEKSLNGNYLDYGSEALYHSFNETDPGEEFYEEMAARVQAARDDGADAIVVYIHWGIEFTYEESPEQVAIAQALADMDVDLIIGCHPHVVQPMDVFTSSTSGKKVPCAYSLGSIISPMGEDEAYVNCEDGVILTADFTKDENGTRLTGVRIVPIWICNYETDGQEFFRAMPVKAEMAEDAFCLADAENGVERAEASYARTGEIVGIGYNKIRKAFPG